MIIVYILIIPYISREVKNKFHEDSLILYKYILKKAPMHLCTYAPMHLCTYAPMHLCTYAPMLETDLFHFIANIRNKNIPKKYIIIITEYEPQTLRKGR